MFFKRRLNEIFGILILQQQLILLILLINSTDRSNKVFAQFLHPNVLGAGFRPAGTNYNFFLTLNASSSSASTTASTISQTLMDIAEPSTVIPIKLSSPRSRPTSGVIYTKNLENSEEIYYPSTTTDINSAPKTENVSARTDIHEDLNYSSKSGSPKEVTKNILKVKIKQITTQKINDKRVPPLLPGVTPKNSSTTETAHQKSKTQGNKPINKFRSSRLVNGSVRVSSNKTHSAVVGMIVPSSGNKPFTYDRNLNIIYGDGFSDFFGNETTIEQTTATAILLPIRNNNNNTTSNNNDSNINNDNLLGYSPRNQRDEELNGNGNDTVIQQVFKRLDSRQNLNLVSSTAATAEENEQLITEKKSLTTASSPIYKFEPNITQRDTTVITPRWSKPAILAADSTSRLFVRPSRPPLFPQYIYSIPVTSDNNDYNNNNNSLTITTPTRHFDVTLPMTNKTNRTCTDIFDAYNCTCPPGFNGSVCQHNIDDCNPYPCVNGVCVDGINSYECQCQPGYTGKRCDIKIDPCSHHNCLNNGVCKQFGDINYTCACDGPFVGDFCQIPIDYDCSRNGNICANNATCETGYFLLDNNKTVTFKCVCPSGFDGLLCDTERNFCKSNKCVYGECHSNRYFENYTCDCKIGYTGKYCDQDLDECQQNVTSLCLNGGTCRNNIGNYTCECLKGWTGPRCEIDIDECLGIGACLHTGICKNTEGDYSCNCSGTGYEGKTCEVDIDECSEEASKSGVPKCTDNGRCVNEPGFYRCECHQGYSGPRCESANCSLIRCENNGTCQINADDNTWRCICSNNSYGLFCENLSSCLNKPCKSGICYNIPNIAHGLNYTCECDANHTGPNCTEPNGCLTQPCGAGATCLNIPNQQYTNMNYTCVCPPQNNSSGPHCKPLDHCLNNLCVNGDCVSNGFNYTCKCLPGYSGTFCSINTDECQVNPCNNSGRCVDGINSYKCICDGTGFQGAHCDEDIDECLNNPCRNNGSCVNLPGSYRCDCPEYLGDDCEIKNPCAPNPCFNGGKCKVAITNEYTIAECVCPEPFLGELCQNDPRVKPLKVTSPHKRTTYIVAPLSATILFAGLVSLIAFMLTAKKKRATRGAYSPSKQEINGPSVTLDHVLKPPPEERLI